MGTQHSAISQMTSTQLSRTEMALLDRPQIILEDPPADSKRAQQVRRLEEEHGLHKAAGYVKACGRLGEKWDYECGRSFVRKIIRSHLRFCCQHCDQHVASRLFSEHRAYRELLHPSGTLYRVTFISTGRSLSSSGIRDFEDMIVGSVRRQLKDVAGWGWKSFTHYEAGYLVAKGILYLPPGVSMIFDSLSIPLGTCTVSQGASVSAFETILTEILRPCITEGAGVLRADLMAAFQGGNHLRSLGVLYGLISKRRKKERLEQDREKLHLIETLEESGAGLVEERSRRLSYVPPCPHCGPGCRRVSVSTEPLSELEGIPSFENDDATEDIWREMRDLLRRRYVF